MKHYFIALIVISFLTSCISPQVQRANFEAQLDTWKGVKEEKLVEHFGIPDKTHEAKGIRYLGFVKDKGAYYTGHDLAAPSMIYGNRYNGSVVGLTYNTGGRTIIYSCEVTFILKRGVVTGYTYEGNWCR